MGKSTKATGDATRAAAKKKQASGAKPRNRGGATTVKGAPLLRELFSDVNQQIHVEIVSVTYRKSDDTYAIGGKLSDGGHVQDNVKSLGAAPHKGELWSFSVESFVETELNTKDEKATIGTMPIGKKIS